VRGQVERGLLPEHTNAIEQLPRGRDIWKIGTAGGKVRRKFHSVKNVLVIEEGEGFDVEDEVEAARRSVTPLPQQLLQFVGYGRRIGVLPPEGFCPLRQAVVSFQELDDVVETCGHELVETARRSINRPLVRE
jgi:TPP-dependent indolepyruvate ferredoxin oxidoreductase alpha subunit